MLIKRYKDGEETLLSPTTKIGVLHPRGAPKREILAATERR
jgi:hypothetical protein